MILGAGKDHSGATKSSPDLHRSSPGGYLYSDEVNIEDNSLYSLDWSFDKSGFRGVKKELLFGGSSPYPQIIMGGFANRNTRMIICRIYDV